MASARKTRDLIWYDFMETKFRYVSPTISCFFRGLFFVKTGGGLVMI